jgi:hypothetical protein
VQYGTGGDSPYLLDIGKSKDTSEVFPVVN